MTYEEYVTWVEYRRKNGPLNPMLRNDRGFALVACMLTGEKDLKKFMPWGPHTGPQVEDLSDQEPATLEDVNMLVGGRIDTKFKRYDPNAPAQ